MNRDCLPDTRDSITRTFKIPISQTEKMKVYVTVGMYPDGRLGEVFIRADKVGSLASGAFDAVAMCISVALQYGVPLEAFTSKLRHTRFEPAGFTGDKEFPSCSSVLDLIANWLETIQAKKERTV